MEIKSKVKSVKPKTSSSKTSAKTSAAKASTKSTVKKVTPKTTTAKKTTAKKATPAKKTSTAKKSTTTAKKKTSTAKKNILGIDLSDIDITAYAKKIVAQLTGNELLMASFKKNAAATVKKIMNVDVSESQVSGIVDTVKNMLGVKTTETEKTAEKESSNPLGLLSKLFKK